MLILAHLTCYSTQVQGFIITTTFLLFSWFWFGAFSGLGSCGVSDGYFKYIFVNEKFCISIQISQKFIPKGPVDIKSALGQVMAWHWTGDKPLPEPMQTYFSDAYMCFCVPMNNQQQGQNNNLGIIGTRASAAMMFSFPGLIWVLQDKVNSLWPSDAYMPYKLHHNWFR